MERRRPNVHSGVSTVEHTEWAWKDKGISLEPGQKAGQFYTHQPKCPPRWCTKPEVLLHNPEKSRLQTA